VLTLARLLCDICVNAGTQGVAAIMLAHVTVPALDRHYGVHPPGAMPASMSRGALRYLREDLGFDNVAITDDLEMGVSGVEGPNSTESGPNTA
jgi:beta-glucosidase-like glycosyl hydrolase